MFAADLLERLFCIYHLADRHTVQETAGQRHQHDNLFGDGRRFELRLYENGPDALSVVDNLAGVFIEPCANWRRIPAL